MNFNFSHVDEAFDTLSKNAIITNALIDHWEDSEGNAWTAKEVTDFVRGSFNVDLSLESDAFSYVYAFFNQQMAFDVIGYTSMENLDNANGERLLAEPEPFLQQLLSDDEFWQKMIGQYTSLKIRSNNGDYSTLVYGVEDIERLSRVYIKETT